MQYSDPGTDKLVYAFSYLSLNSLINYILVFGLILQMRKLSKVCRPLVEAVWCDCRSLLISPQGCCAST